MPTVPHGRQKERELGNMPYYTENKKRQKLVKTLTFFYLVPLATMVIFNSFNSLLRTTYFELYKDMETAKYKWDQPFLVLMASAVLLFVIYLVCKAKWFEKISHYLLVAVLFSGTISVFIVLTVCGIAICDGEALSNIAIEFMQSNYETLSEGEYLFNYSFQIGMVALLEVIYRIFGIENYLVFQMLNVISIMIFIRMLGKITDELFENKRVSRIEAILSLGMLPLFLFSTFVYGDIIGWAFGISAIYFVIRYLKADKWQFVITASVLLSLGIVVKSNINILVVASVIAILLNAIYKKRFQSLLWIMILIIISQFGMGAVQAVYTQRAGLSKYPEGIPKIAWVAMSMQETDEGGYACGWYNGYNWAVYRENEYDRARTTQACVQNLKQSLHKLIHEQRYALNFVYKKFTSQWNAPTFQAMITNEWSMRHTDNDSVLAHYFVFERGRDILYELMNIYHFLLFFCTSAYFLLNRGKWSLPKAYYILNIFGGFLFHMIWEAQSRYILGYFVLMLPLAACGCERLLAWIEKKTALKAIKEENGNETA